MAAWNGVRTVELAQAFLWTCDDCGRDNFERAVTVGPESLEGQEVAELALHVAGEANESAQALGIEVGGDWLMAPRRVKCQHCRAEFATTEDE
jgi:hypothetical protein